MNKYKETFQVALFALVLSCVGQQQANASCKEMCDTDYQHHFETAKEWGATVCKDNKGEDLKNCKIKAAAFANTFTAWKTACYALCPYYKGKF